MSATDRASAILLGLDCGDALSRPGEFRSATQIKQEFGQLNEMIGHGTHNQPAGTIVDDTELALRIARSLVEREAFDGADVADRFVEWYQSGSFDIGLMTADALQRIKTARRGTRLVKTSGRNDPKDRMRATTASCGVPPIQSPSPKTQTTSSL